MTTLSDPAFVDTNVLVYAADESAAFHGACQHLLDRAADGALQLVLSPQILSEFVAVVTNPNVMPRPLSPDDAYAHAEQLGSICRVVTPMPAVVQRWISLLRQTGISGKRVHDMLHVATMLESGIEQIYTYDSGFVSVPGITVLDPKDAAQ